MTKSNPSPFWIRLCGPLVFLSALALYLVTLSRGAFPGDSARLIVEQAGLDAFPALNYPLYGLLARLLNHVPVATLALRLNFASALFGAIAVWLLYRITASLPRNRTFEEQIASFHEPTVQAISGLVAAGVFALCIPFWISASRANVAPLNMTLLLTAVWAVLRYGETQRFGWLAGSVFLYALGATNFATMILAAPVFACIVLVFLMRAQHTRPRQIGLLLLCGLVGLLPYAFQMWHYSQQAAAGWRKFSGLHEILYQLLYAQYAMIAHGVPKMGWLTVGFVSVVPWLTVIGFRVAPGGTRTSGAWFGTYLLNFLLLGLAGLVLANAIVSPWRLTGLRPLLVTPYAIVAMWAGYVVGYWHVVLVHRPRGDATARPSVGRRVAGGLLLAGVAASLALVAMRNLPITDGRTARPVQELTKAMAGQLKGHELLVSASPIDDLLLISAREQGQPLRIINHDLARQASYLNYVASLFPQDLRLQGLAHIGLTPVLTEWLQADPAARGKLAVFSTPDLWYAGGLAPLPDRSYYRASSTNTADDLEALMAAHRQFWAEAAPLLAQDPKVANLAAPWVRFLGRHLAKIANNLGVLLEDRKRDDLAVEAYVQARRFEPRNISALLNLTALCRRDNRPELSALEDELKKLPANIAVQSWALSYHYGYVRTPEAYASRGWAWAMTGKPNPGMDDMQAAVAMGTNTANLRLSMANLFFAENPAESEKLLIGVLRERPNDQRAMLGLARNAMRKGDFDSARQYLGRLREQGANDAAVSIEEAITDAFAGRPAEARNRLLAVVKKNPGNQRALMFLALLAAEQNDEKTVEDCLRQLKMGRTTPPAVLLAVGHLAMARHDLVNARKHFAQYLRLRPMDKAALEQMVMLDRVAGDRDSAERHVEGLLSLDPGNALGNFVLGHLQGNRGEYALAEASLRASLATQRLPDALNELAWMLCSRGRLQEAEKLAQECVALVPNHPEAWDTLGLILLRSDKVAEAEKALQKAIQITPDDAEVMLHTALLLEKKSQFGEALKLADGLLARPSAFDKPAYEELRELVQRLRTRV